LPRYVPTIPRPVLKTKICLQTGAKPGLSWAV
jgi:hypothetical protein